MMTLNDVGRRAVRAAGILSISLFAARAVVTNGPAYAVGESPAKAYVLHCVGCHMYDGMGSTIGHIPQLPGIAGHFLKHPKGRIYLTHVPGVVNAGLPDDETAAVLNYVLETWAKAEMPADAKPFTGEEVGQLRKIKVDDITVLRKEIQTDLAKQGIILR